MTSDNGNGEGWANVAAAATIVCLVIAIALGLGSLHIAERVDGNSKRVERNSLKLNHVVVAQCNRTNLSRAETQFRARLAPPDRIRSILDQLGLDPSTAPLYGEKALEHRLPILDCRPTAHGNPPRVLSPKAQRRFVTRYARDAFNPVTGEPRK